MRRSTAFALVALGFAACASTLPIERREYILSRPHGWIEIEVRDAAVPSVPASEEDATRVRPPTCYFDVSLDREPFVEGRVYPEGEAEPFRVESGFRFPVPVGTVAIAVTYSACDLPSEGQAAGHVDVSASVPVAEGMVTDVAFDGEALGVGSPRADTMVTLERIYDAVSDGASSH